MNILRSVQSVFHHPSSYRSSFIPHRTITLPHISHIMLASTNPLRLATRQCSRLPALVRHVCSPTWRLSSSLPPSSRLTHAHTLPRPFLTSNQRAYASAPHGAQGGAGGGPANLANPTGEHKATSHESGRMTPQGGSPNYALIVAGAGVAGYIVRDMSQYGRCLSIRLCEARGGDADDGTWTGILILSFLLPAPFTLCLTLPPLHCHHCRSQAWKYFASATEAKDQLASTNLRQTGATGSTGENDPVLTRVRQPSSHSISL